MQNTPGPPAQTFNPPAIRGDQRVFFVGKTNSGKSYVARYLLKLMRAHGWRIVIIDPKKDWMGRGEARREYGGQKGPWKRGTIDHPVMVTSFDPSLYVQIFQPVEWDASMETAAADIMATGNTIVYIDEVTQLVSGAHDPPKGLKIMITQGRSANVGVWVGTQRPMNVPVIVKDQAEVWLIFRLTRYEDRQTVEGHIPTEETPSLVEEPLPIRYFWYYEDSMPRPILVAPLKIEKAA